MGSQGGVVIYATSEVVDVSRALVKGFALSGAATANNVLALRLPSSLDGEGDIIACHKNATPEHIKGLISEDHVLWIELSNSNWREWQAAFATEIPEAVRGSFSAAAARMVVGSHPIEELTQYESARVIARTRFAFHVWAWGSPNDWVEYRRLAPTVSVVKRIQSEFAAEGIETQIYCTWQD